jgi:predicted metal-dependent enzyme (double-stranded beta helix superfamily)
VLDTTQEAISLRTAGREVAAAYDEYRDDFGSFVEVATPICRRLIERPDLPTLGFAIGTHRAPMQLLYNDGELSIIIAHEPFNEAIPVHDHGMWEMLGLWRGRLDHCMYRRVDDGTRPGYAELDEVDRLMMEPGDVICVPPPPHDLHGFTAQTDDTYLVAILPGWYNDVRRYFDVQRKSYFLRGRTPV